MHLETKTPSKELFDLDVPSIILERHSSFLEEDLALSSSTHDSVSEKVLTSSDKTTHDESASSLSLCALDEPGPIYVSEDAMDCNYDESSSASRVGPEPALECSTLELHEEDEPPESPELFESDADDEAESTNTTSTYQATLEEVRTQPSPRKYTQAELVLRADKLTLKRVHKYLSGVPPPPNHTISQRDCDDFLAYIKQNRSYFWADPFKLDKHLNKLASDASSSQQETHQEMNEDTSSACTSNSFHQPKAGLRNLSTAFDACEQLNDSRLDRNYSLPLDTEFSDTTCSFSLSETLFNNCSISTSTLTLNEDSKLNDSTDDKEKPPTLYNSTTVDEVANLSWPEVYKHRCHDIYHNRNRAVEEFENLRMKLCDRYIGAETQSTCNVWFASQLPSSARKRSLLAKRNNGQSPGKRLSYLARRRRTFSSANLQGLCVAEKKRVLLNVKKVLTRKGKSPRGKSPRGKTPRSSAKKRHLRKLLLEGPSPRKTKIETSKRALFQSPPTERPGPSRPAVTATITNNNTQKIKRALFPTPKKTDGGDSCSQPQSLSYPESRKRKNEEELEHSRHKWAKSLSFDCARNLDSSSSNSCYPVRHSTGSALLKDGKCELSETHRKKLHWAVAQALRSKGIGMNHPMFKQFANPLARTVRKYMPDLENTNIPRKPGSTSDRMLKLAKRHVILIVESNKTAL